MTDVKMTDEEYMGLALKLAQKGEGRVNPNPLVGAVIVKDGMIIGRGYHREYGGPHAEREALASLTRTARGATLYVTLEPCCHCGKTPPCTDAIMESGISRVVIGTADPNPLVAGQGISLLNSHGIQVVQGVLEAECISQNQVFFHFIRTKQPYVVMKYAMTMDGGPGFPDPDGPGRHPLRHAGTMLPLRKDSPLYGCHYGKRHKPRCHRDRGSQSPGGGTRDLPP